MAVTTTLPLFWHLSSSAKEERLESSVKLISALEDFQERYGTQSSKGDNRVPSTGTESDSDEDESGNPPAGNELWKVLENENAADVAYAIRRLIRGLASPRESSRLGFAVALTELLKRVDTVSCEQILALLNAACQNSGGLSKQEERDLLFAQLFGVKAIIQSGLLVTQKPLKSSSSGTSSLKAFQSVCEKLVELGEAKSWIRESCWWTLGSAIDRLHASSVPWKEEAFKNLTNLIYNDESWTAEKVAMTIKLQDMNVAADRKVICGSTFKDPDLLAKANLQILARILKDSVAVEGDAQSPSKSTTTPWKPQLHFAWNTILSSLLCGETSKTRSFSDFYRVVVDESLFSGSSSSERKYWGFLVFKECLGRLPPSEIPLILSKNFMRTWINHLSKDDRYLNKIARQVSRDLESAVEKNPEIGFSVMLQLIGVNGSSSFDQITKTKTVENILASTSQDGIRCYIQHLLSQVNGSKDDEKSNISLDARRMWIIDQVTALLRRGGVPKSTETTEIALDWLVTHAFFVQKPSKKSKAIVVPEPPFTEALRKTCVTKLHSCLAELIVRQTEKQSTLDESSKKVVHPCDALAHVLATIKRLDADAKHYKPSQQLSEDLEVKWDAAVELLEHLKTRENCGEEIEGVSLLIQGLVLLCRSGSEDEDDWEILQDCTETVKTLPGMWKVSSKKKPKKTATEELRPPIDFIVDVVIGLLERSTAFSKALATQTFIHLTGLLSQSAVELILTQLERRSPTGGSESEEEDLDFDDDDDDKSQSDQSEGAILNEEAGVDGGDEAALRAALDVVISGSKGDDDDDDIGSKSSVSSMDDEQMMAIDEQLTEVFKSEAEKRGKRKNADAQREATHFKNRVLDLVEIYMRRQPTNALVLKFIVPLLDIVLTSSSDERQLSDKTRGILKARTHKVKDIPTLAESSEAKEIVEALHDRARRASSADAASLISGCVLFVSKALLPCDEVFVVEAYGNSVKDFISRKASALNPTFFFDFIRRFPLESLPLQAAITGVLGDAANGFRLAQAFTILQKIYSSLSPSNASSALPGMAQVAEALEVTITTSCADGKLSASQMKDTLKAAQQMSRLSKRIADSASTVAKIWVSAKWESLAEQLSSSKHYLSSPSLPNMCISIARTSRPQTREEKGASGGKTSKRKIEGSENVEKRLRKKSKKSEQST